VEPRPSVWQTVLLVRPTAGNRADRQLVLPIIVPASLRQPVTVREAACHRHPCPARRGTSVAGELAPIFVARIAIAMARTGIPAWAPVARNCSAKGNLVRLAATARRAFALATAAPTFAAQAAVRILPVERPPSARSAAQAAKPTRMSCVEALLGAAPTIFPWSPPEAATGQGTARRCQSPVSAISARAGPARPLA
jgi:hypothetical protein